MSGYRTEVTGWVGWVSFAAVMLMFVGVFDIVQGIIALADDDFAVAISGGLLVFNVTAWGWVHVIGGAILLVVGIGLASGQWWARVVGVIVAALNALAQLTIMPSYPFWATLMIALNVVVIYAIVVHGQEAKVA
jgi:hypothetical protein